eukprot:gene18346-20188_t
MAEISGIPRLHKEPEDVEACPRISLKPDAPIIVKYASRKTSTGMHSKQSKAGCRKMSTSDLGFHPSSPSSPTADKIFINESLTSRNNNLLRLAKIKKQKCNFNEIEITDFSYVVYQAFLRYLYSDEVQIAPDDAIGLLDLAYVYCETNLKQKCQNLIKQSISVENCSSLMDAAIQYHVTDLENFCFSFMVSHLIAVTQTEAFKNLDGEIVKKLSLKRVN